MKIVADIASPHLLSITLHELQHALLSEQFTLYYQPIMDTNNQRLVGVEALLRWQHPTHGLLAPDAFISLCEKSGFIIPLGTWVCHTAAQQVKQWQQMGLAHLYVSINLSAIQLNDPALIEHIQSALRSANLSANSLCLEITESQAISNAYHSLETLTALHNMGVQLSLDDFGTGYGSLLYLKYFPFHYLKIDKLFIRDMATNFASARIIEAMIQLGKSLGLKLIAEGVETVKQVEKLTELQCDALQGFLFSKPVSAKTFSESFIYQSEDAM